MSLRTSTKRIYFFTLVESTIEDIPQVTEEKNEALITNFTENEVRDAIFSNEATVEFY
jgi:hypothetical protein